MSTDSRLTRAAASTGPDGLTQVTATAVTSARRGRTLVRVVVWWTRAWRAAGQAIATAAEWSARTVRPAGVLVAIAATIGLGVGIAFGWIEWMVAGAVSVLLIVASIPFLFGARAYDVDLSLAHERVVAGDGVTGEIVVRNHGRRIALPGRIDLPVGAGLVEFGVPLLRPGHTVAQPLDIPALARGIVIVGPATTVRSDPIGLLRREHAFEDVHRLYVHPRTTALPSTSAGLIRDLEGSPTRRLVDSDMSFHAIREYAAGDSRRQIHWKSTAKTGRLMVRQYEESRRSRMAVVLAVAESEYADPDEFELAVSCAASLGLRAVRDARDVAIVTGSEIPRVVRGRLRAISHLPSSAPRPMLDAFSGVDRLESTMPIADVCRLTAESGDGLSIAFVVVGSRVSLARLQQAALAFAADTTVVAVICDERAHPRMRALSALTVLTVGTRDDLSGLLLRGATGCAQDAVVPRERPPIVVPRVLAGSVFGAVVVLTAAVAAWPIYRSWSYVLLVIVGALAAGAIAAVAWRRRWRGWTVTGVVAGAFLILGVPLAVPSRLGTPMDVLRGLGELTSGVLLAWKDLVTVDLPVGSYRNLLVPALVVFLVGTCALLLLSWREDRIAYAAVPIAIGMVSFGLFFGRTTVSAPWELGPVTLHAPIETGLGLAALLASLVWLAWRTHDERFRALQRAAASSGVRVSRRPSLADRRRVALGAGMVAVALLVVVAIVPAAAQGLQREVLRSAVGPEIDLARAVSPLAEYRGLFADSRADDVLFTVGSDGELPERVRIATLDSYDGEVYRSGGSAAVDAGRFVRVPSVLDAGPGTPVQAAVTVQDLEGIWMPTAGQLASVDFKGARAASLADRFYYSAAAAAGVQTAGGGLEPGDSYVVHGVERPAADLTTIDAPGGVSEGVAPPASLRTWVDKHATGSDGAALAGLVALLRERGYLSHGLAEGTTPAVWTQSLTDYRFQPSASGHSLARIDTLFARLLERETDPRAASTGNYVAAVGDDEQFAVAVSLIAQELGFPARVVLGARLGSAQPGLTTCGDDGCRAQDLAVWTEVQSSSGEWVPIDVTPQYAQSPSLDVTEQRDPENVTEVRPDSVEEVVPPDPIQEDTAADDASDQPAGVDLAWLWQALRVTGVVLLVAALVLGPFIIVLAAKSVRRRTRRREGEAATRIAGGWDEYVDAAVDAGHDAPPAFTRAELAQTFASPSGGALAVTADRAVFSGTALADDDADAFWETVDAERRTFLRERKGWHRLAATVSLRSFIRHLAPAAGARKRFTERGKRRVSEPVRLTP